MGNVEIMARSSSHLFLIEQPFNNTIRSPHFEMMVTADGDPFPEEVGLYCTRITYFDYYHTITVSPVTERPLQGATGRARYSVPQDPDSSPPNDGYEQCPVPVATGVVQMGFYLG